MKTLHFQSRPVDLMEKGDNMSHSFALNDPYMVHVEEMEDEVDPLNAELAEGTDDSNHEEKVGAPLREQDRFLPIANVAKIMKKAIPESGKVNNKIAKDARECVQECVSEFISFITSEASDRCHMEKRKTINGEDILFAMSSLGFDNYVEPLKVYLQKYREQAAKSDKNLAVNQILFEDLPEESYTPAVASNVLAENATTEAAVIYTYQDNIPTHQFQLGFPACKILALILSFLFL